MSKSKPWVWRTPTFHVNEPGDYFLKLTLGWKLIDAKTNKKVARTKVKK